MKNMKSLITSGLLTLAGLVGCSSPAKGTVSIYPFAGVSAPGYVPPETTQTVSSDNWVPLTEAKQTTPVKTVDVQVLKPVQTQTVEVQVAQPVQVQPVQVVKPVVVQPVQVQPVQVVKPVVVQPVQVQPVQPVVVRTVEVEPVYTPVVVPSPILPWYSRWSFSWFWGHKPHHHSAPVVHRPAPAPRQVGHHRGPAPQRHHGGHQR